jgi:hypothetical protein
MSDNPHGAEADHSNSATAFRQLCLGEGPQVARIGALQNEQARVGVARIVHDARWRCWVSPGPYGTSTSGMKARYWQSHVSASMNTTGSTPGSA